MRYRLSYLLAACLFSVLPSIIHGVEALTHDRLLALLDPPDPGIAGYFEDKLYFHPEKVHFSEEGPSLETEKGDSIGLELLSFDERSGCFFLRVPPSFSLEASDAIWDYWRCSNGHLNPPWSLKCGVLQCGERRYGR